LVCAFISASLSSGVSLWEFRKHRQCNGSLLSAFAELFDPEPASVPDAKLGFSNAAPWKMLREIAFSRHAGPVSFRHRPLVCPVRLPIDSESRHHLGEIKWVRGTVVNISNGRKGNSLP
jgi:hypothetical protein